MYLKLMMNSTLMIFSVLTEFLHQKLSHVNTFSSESQTNTHFMENSRNVPYRRASLSPMFKLEYAYSERGLYIVEWEEKDRDITFTNDHIVSTLRTHCCYV